MMASCNMEAVRESVMYFCRRVIRRSCAARISRRRDNNFGEAESSTSPRSESVREMASTSPRGDGSPRAISLRRGYGFSGAWVFSLTLTLSRGERGLPSPCGGPSRVLRERAGDEGDFSVSPLLVFSNAFFRLRAEISVDLMSSMSVGSITPPRRASSAAGRTSCAPPMEASAAAISRRASLVSACRRWTSSRCVDGSNLRAKSAEAEKAQ